MKKLVQTKSTNVLAILILFIFSSCSPSSDPLRKFVGSYRNYTNVNGKIKNGTYYEPYGRFSIKVPNMVTPGMIIDGKFIESGGTIGFRDDFGALVRIDLITAIDNESKKFLVDDNWKLVFPRVRNNFLSLYKETVPNSTLIYQKDIVWNGKNADSFVVDLKKSGAIRTSIGFMHKGSFYLISTQPSMLVISGKNLEDDIKQRIDYTKRIVETIILN